MRQRVTLRPLHKLALLLSLLLIVMLPAPNELVRIKLFYILTFSLLMS